MSINECRSVCAEACAEAELNRVVDPLLRKLNSIVMRIVSLAGRQSTYTNILVSGRFTTIDIPCYCALVIRNTILPLSDLEEDARFPNSSWMVTVYSKLYDSIYILPMCPCCHCPCFLNSSCQFSLGACTTGTC